MKNIEVSLSDLIRYIDGQPSTAYVKFKIWLGDKLLVEDVINGNSKSVYRKRFLGECNGGVIRVEYETSAPSLTIKACVVD